MANVPEICPFLYPFCPRSSSASCSPRAFCVYTVKQSALDEKEQKFSTLPWQRIYDMRAVDRTNNTMLVKMSRFFPENFCLYISTHTVLSGSAPRNYNKNCELHLFNSSRMNRKKFQVEIIIIYAKFLFFAIIIEHALFFRRFIASQRLLEGEKREKKNNKNGS